MPDNHEEEIIDDKTNDEHFPAWDDLAGIKLGMVINRDRTIQYYKNGKEETEGEKIVDERQIVD